MAIDFGHEPLTDFVSVDELVKWEFSYRAEYEFGMEKAAATFYLITTTTTNHTLTLYYD